MFHILKAQDTCALTAILLTCNLEDPGSSASVSYLLTDFSAMTGFRPDGLRRFGTVLCAQLRSSGFPYSLAPKPARRQASVTVHRIAYFIFHIRRRHAPHRYYTRPGAKMQALSALPQIFCRTVKSRHAQALTNRVPASCMPVRLRQTLPSVSGTGAVLRPHGCGRCR